MAFPSAKSRPATYEDILRLPENVVGEIIAFTATVIFSPAPMVPLFRIERLTRLANASPG